jgi:hypothetical protein
MDMYAAGVLLVYPGVFFGLLAAGTIGGIFRIA